MNRFSLSAAALAPLAQIAGILALGAFLVVAPGETAFLPSQALMRSSACPEKEPAVADSGLTSVKACRSARSSGLEEPRPGTGMRLARP